MQINCLTQFIWKFRWYSIFRAICLSWHQYIQRHFVIKLYFPMTPIPLHSKEHPRQTFIIEDRWVLWGEIKSLSKRTEIPFLPFPPSCYASSMARVLMLLCLNWTPVRVNLEGVKRDEKKTAKEKLLTVSINVSDDISLRIMSRQKNNPIKTGWEGTRFPPVDHCSRPLESSEPNKTHIKQPRDNRL